MVLALISSLRKFPNTATAFLFLRPRGKGYGVRGGIVIEITLIENNYGCSAKTFGMKFRSLPPGPRPAVSVQRASKSHPIVAQIA